MTSRAYRAIAGAIGYDLAEGRGIPKGDTSALLKGAASYSWWPQVTHALTHDSALLALLKGYTNYEEDLEDTDES